LESFKLTGKLGEVPDRTHKVRQFHSKRAEQSPGTRNVGFRLSFFAAQSNDNDAPGDGRLCYFGKE